MSNIENSILKLEPHQERAYESVNDLYKNGKYAAVIFPTGCGKSFVTLKYIEDHPDEKILFLSPRCSINQQIYEYIVRFIGGRTENIEDIKNEFGNLKKAAQSFIPEIKAMTYQSLLDINKKDSSIRKLLNKIKPNLIVIDEMHHVKTKNNTFGNGIEEDEENLTENEKQELRKEENEWGKCFQKLLDEFPDAKVLGLSATPIRTDGANVVERIFENSVASEISLLEAIELEIITPPRYVVPDFLKEDELQTLLEKIENADEDKKPELKQKYDELVEKSEKAPGIPELMNEHITEEDGKYIVFCKDIKDMEDKKSKAKEWFEKIDKEPTIYSVSTYGYDENGEKRKINPSINNKILKDFENDNSEHLKLMYCVGMIEEGVHLDDVSGIILATKTESRPAYLQRIGRTISAVEKHKETLVIDLVNNNEILLDRNTYKKGYEIEDIEALEALVDWIENKNEGKLPDLETAKSNKEIVMAKRLRRLNNKYYKYVEDEKLLENLDEEKIEEIESIIMLGEDIGLWDEFIELDEKEKKIADVLDTFQENTVIKGVRKDLKNILEELNIRQALLNISKIENWCREKYGEKEIWKRKLPSSISKDEEEKKLGNALIHIKRITNQYEGEKIQDESVRKMVETLRDLEDTYGFASHQPHFKLGQILKFKNLLETKNNDRAIWERTLPSEKATGFSKKQLSDWYNLKDWIKRYEKNELKEIPNKDYPKIKKIYNELVDKYAYGFHQIHQDLGKILKVKNWCDEKNKGNERWKLKLPTTNSENQEECDIARAFNELKVKYNKYRGVELNEIYNDEDRKIVEIIRKINIEYGLSTQLKNILEIQNWCEKENKNKEIWDRHVPYVNSLSDEEKILAIKLSNLKTHISNLQSIKGNEDKEIIHIYNKVMDTYAYGHSQKHCNLGNALEIENWCKKHMRLPKRYDDNKILKKYKGKELAEIENEDDRQIVSELRKEQKLGKKLNALKTKAKKYKGKELAEIENEEDKQILEILERIDKEYNPNAQEKKKLKAQVLGEVGFGSDTKLCDEINSAINKELKKDKDNQKS